MFVSSLVLFSTAFLLQEGSCVIWGSKDSSSGVRGLGQRTPQVFDLPAGGNLEQELKDIASPQLYSERFQKRQADPSDNTDESISFTAILTNDSHSHAIVHWTGHPFENIFFVTRKHNDSRAEESWLWRSTDYGHTFVNETYKLLNDSVIQWYYVSPYTQYLVFMDTINSRLYVTEDAGEYYTTYSTPFKPNLITFQSRLAPNTLDSPYNKYVLGYSFGEETLWVSTDLGATWTKIGDNVPANRYYWRRLDADVEGDLSKVYFEMRTTKDGNESMLYYTTFPYNRTQLFSTDLGRFQSGSFVLEYEYIFVQKPGSIANYNITYSSPLWVSLNRNRKFKQSIFPFLAEEMEHLHFSVIDASESQVFIAVYHDSNTTNLYISDETGTSYSLSLEYIVGPDLSSWAVSNPKFDVYVTEGVVGTYFANQKVPGRSFSSSLITRNKGGHWSRLTPPAVSRLGDPLICAPPDCSLHLRMESDEVNGYQSILSQHTAVGLIMAVGNIGSSLSRTVSDSQVYFSRDGGFTWAQIETGRWEFQHLALGSIIVMVKKWVLVQTIKWSCDEGATWNTVDFVDENFPNGIVVIGLKTEIGEKARYVSVFGLDYFQFVENDFMIRDWLVLTINFTSIVTRQCDLEEDYYGWMPTDERLGEPCLLGEMVTYERRNSSACCFVDPVYEKPTSRAQCTCDTEDFECDFGFERDSLNSPCTPLPWVTYPPLPPKDCPEMENYTYTSGYRKVAGDKCLERSEDVFVLPKTALCPLRPPKALFITYSPHLIKPGVPVTFTLQQYEGSRVSTIYYWSFNDSTPDVDYTGLESAQLQQHTFDIPGVYTISVLATNQAGSSETVMAISVLDILSQFTINYPDDLFEDTVPSSLQLVFSASLLTQHGSGFLGRSVEYSWDFGDGDTIPYTPQSSVMHTYRTNGLFTFSCIVHAVFSTVNNTITKSIRTYNATETVDVSSNELIIKEEGKFARVGYSAMFLAQPPPGSEIPLGTVYFWQIRFTDSSNLISANKTIDYIFPSWGEYQVEVVGRYPSGLFVGSLSVLAESDIGQLTVETRPAVRLRSLLSIQVTVLNGDTDVYMGPISLTVETSNGTQLAAHQSVLADTSDVKLSFSSDSKGVMRIVLKASNDISDLEEELTVIVVDTGEYGSFSIIFNTKNLPLGFDNPEWQQRLSASIVKSIATKSGVKQEYVEIEDVRLTEDSKGKEPKNLKHKLQKRSDELFLTVSVNLLPAEYNEDAISSIKKLSNDVIALVLNKTIVFTVDGVILTADTARERNTEPIIIVDPKKEGSVVVYVVIVLVCIVLSAIITVVLVTVILLNRRRYKRLHAKYSHLDESSGGNLTFNETFGEHDTEKKE